MVKVLLEWEILDVDQVNDIMNGDELCLLCNGVLVKKLFLDNNCFGDVLFNVIVLV